MRYGFLATVMASVLVGDTSGQAAVTASTVTQSGRSLARALKVVLSAPGLAATERTLCLLIDATPSLQKTGFVADLQRAIQANEKQLEKTLLGVASVGSSRFVLAPTRDHGRVVAAVKKLMGGSRNAIRNVYGDVRRLSALLRGKPGKREIVLVTLENGDAEDDIANTVAALRALNIRLSVIARESYLADSYWTKRKRYWRDTRRIRPPKGCEMIGGDTPFIDLPWGWIFQVTVTNEVIPSGFAAYGLTRLAAATGGVVCLYSPPEAAEHECAVYGHCLFCDGDHIPKGEAYDTSKLSQLAPPATSRREAYRAAAMNPYHRATSAAWREAAKVGVILTTPSLRVTGTTARDDRNRGGRDLGFFRSLSFERHARKADETAAACRRIIAKLEAAIERASKQNRPGRHRAMAMLTRFYLYVTRANLISFAGWCREIAPLIVDANYLPAAPEIPVLGEEEYAYGITFTNMCLCHGVRPFYRVRLPGGRALRKSLVELDGVMREFMKEYTNTPYAVAIHRAGLARYSLRRGGAPPRKRPSSKVKKGPRTDGRGRPVRKGGATTGGASGGPKTGK